MPRPVLLQQRCSCLNRVRRFLAVAVSATAAALLFVCLPAGCAATPGSPQINTTLLDSVDLVRMSDLMSESLLASDVDLSQAVIVTDRVVNRTNHIMPIGEKEHFLARLRVTLAQTGVARQRGVVFVARPDETSAFTAPLPADASTTAEHNPSDGRPPGPGPSHALTATFYTLTNVDRMVRTDTYECGFQLLNLRTRQVEWEDAYRVDYAVARGRLQ